MLEVLVIINNYFHDVATALLASSALLMIFVAKLLPEDAGAQTVDYFISVYRKITLIAKVSVVWLFVAGIPRIVYYRRIEWTVAVDNHIIPALIIKHVIVYLPPDGTQISDQKMLRLDNYGVCESCHRK